MSPTAPIRVVGVVVAWNREKLLRDTLAGLAAQTRPLDALIVVDNASTDASPQVAAAHENVTEVLRMPRNVGGAGGFTAGIAYAMAHYDPDYVWIMDDDTAPTPTALAELLKAAHDYPGQPALLAAKAVWTDGREHPMNRPRPRPLLARELAAHAHANDCVPIRSASFVAPLIDARAIREAGLPVADYFLWNDDFEYTARILRRRIGLYVPAAIVVHQTKTFGDSSTNPGARFENEVRNKLWMFTRSRALNPVETVLYGGRSVLRWGQTIAGARAGIEDHMQAQPVAGPRELMRYALAGARGALRGPRTNSVVLAGTPAAASVRAFAAEHDALRERMQGAEPAAAHALGHWQKRMQQAQAPLSTSPHSDKTPEFSALIAVYAGDDPKHFARAFASLSTDQILPPTQIVLVQDGPVGPGLADAIATAAGDESVTLVTLPENVGLASALNAGLEYCKYPVVARADADDISLPHRFAAQLPLMHEYDLIGSALTEFIENEDVCGVTRRLPADSNEIRAVAKFRDPFNHPTVVFRRDAVLAVGGYEDLFRLEDYLLFARMLAAGARACNLPDALVKYRVGAGAYDRRGGLQMLRSELVLQRKLHQLGFTNSAQYLRNLAIRAGYRLVPTRLRQVAYRAAGIIAWFRS